MHTVALQEESCFFFPKESYCILLGCLLSQSGLGEDLSILVFMLTANNFAAVSPLSLFIPF